MQPISSSRSSLRVSVGRNVSSAGPAYARETIEQALEHAPEPVTSARVRLVGHRDAAVADRIVAQANVDMQGRLVRVQVAAASTREAVDLLAARLKSRLGRLARHWEAIRGSRSVPARHQWRHGDVPRPHLPYFPRPAEQREVLRRKSFALPEQTCEDAALDMELLDYDFHLFREAGSGRDSVLYRTADSGYRLAQTDPQSDTVTRGGIGPAVSPTPAPLLDVEGAIVRLELCGWPFVFFRDRESNRGCVLYHRYDGHYGLITPTGWLGHPEEMAP